jgi:hypothetical protein
MTQPPAGFAPPALGTRSREPAWAAYAAGALALASAAVSFYWVLGGTAGVDTLGGTLEELVRARDPRVVALGLVAGLLKVAGGLLALALVRPWGRRLPRRLLLATAWLASAVLTVYGAVLVAAGALVLGGVLDPAGPVDRTALWSRVLVWDLWFLVWGVLLGVATRQYQTHTPSSRAQAPNGGR